MKRAPARSSSSVDAHQVGRQQAHCREHRKAAADAYRDAEGGKAFLLRQAAQGTPVRVSGDDDPFPGRVFAHPVFEHLIDPKELGQGLGGGARLTDDVDVGAPQVQAVQDAEAEIGIDVVEHPEAGAMLPPANGQAVVLRVHQGLLQGPGPQGRAADPQDQEVPAPLQHRFGHPADLLENFRLVGQLHETEAAVLPGRGQVLGQGRGVGVQVGQIRVAEALGPHKLGHGVIIIEFQGLAGDPLRVLVAFG